MRRVMLASLVGSAVALVAVAGYAAADVLDVAPGILTLDRPVAAPTPTCPARRRRCCCPSPPPPSTRSSPTPARTRPRPPEPACAGRSPRHPTTRRSGRAPASACATASRARSCGPSARRRPACPPRPRSCWRRWRLPTAWTSTDRMATSVVALPGSADVVLVVGGDTLLAPGAGDPEAVAGRAGLADLAAQVAASLAPSGRTSVRLRLDTTHAPGPRYPSTWNPHDVRDGFTQAVVMTGLATQLPARPAPLAAATREGGGRRARRPARRPRHHGDPAARTHLVDRGADGRPGARQRRVGDLRRGARLRPGPQRERPHREPHPTGRRGIGPVDDPPGRQREVHPRAAGRPRRADGRAGHHRRLRAQPRAEGRRRHPVGGAGPGCHRRGRRAARGGGRAFRCRGCRGR